MNYIVTWMMIVHTWVYDPTGTKVEAVNPTKIILTEHTFGCKYFANQFKKQIDRYSEKTRLMVDDRFKNQLLYGSVTIDDTVYITKVNR